MSRAATIVVLTNAWQGFDPDSTLAHIARKHWTPGGHRILIHRGTGPSPRGDVAFQHVDLTRLPPDYAALADRYPVTINGAVTDISKRRFSAGLIRKGDAYDGPAIVKTDLNHAGLPERQDFLRRAGACGRLMNRVVRRFPPAWTGRLSGDRYVVFDNVRDVPGWVWRNPALIVQKLFAERRGQHFVMHQWYFLGDRDCVSSLVAREPLVKLATVAERLPLHADVPPSIRRQRATMGFDYGKFDFVMHEGEPILIDTNRTPNEGPDGDNSRVNAICATLAGGLNALLP